MSNQDKFTTQSNKLKVHRAKLQTISSYSVRFSVDILFSSLVSLLFCLPVFLFLNYTITHFFLKYTFDCAGGCVIKKFSPGRFPVTGLIFFCLILVYCSHKQSSTISYLNGQNNIGRRNYQKLCTENYVRPKNFVR